RRCGFPPKRGPPASGTSLSPRPPPPRPKTRGRTRKGDSPCWRPNRPRYRYGHPSRTSSRISPESAPHPDRSAGWAPPEVPLQRPGDVSPKRAFFHSQRTLLSADMMAISLSIQRNYIMSTVREEGECPSYTDMQ